MAKIRGTAGVRAVLRKWAEDRSDPIRADHAQDAYLSTAAFMGHEGPIYYLVVHEEMLNELRDWVQVEEVVGG